jgi:drug/metabolite transporter (DMT)-like permease
MAKFEYIALMIYVAASTAGVVMIKKFFNGIHYADIYGFIYQLFNLNLVIGVLLYVTGFITWLYVLSKMSLNTAYPIAITLSFLAIMISSTLLLKEKFTLNVGIGSLLCVVGIIYILK